MAIEKFEIIKYMIRLGTKGEHFFNGTKILLQGRLICKGEDGYRLNIFAVELNDDVPKPIY